MILIKNANLYNPYKMGIKDILVSGSSIEYIDERIIGALKAGLDAAGEDYRILVQGYNQKNYL
mgnify:CR=1 FL=1